MTTTPDTEWDLTVLDEHDHQRACEALSHFHTGDSPAAWITYWKGTEGCHCSGAKLLCTPCKDKVLANNIRFVVCWECGACFDGPLHRLMVRIEPLQ